MVLTKKKAHRKAEEKNGARRKREVGGETFGQEILQDVFEKMTSVPCRLTFEVGMLDGISDS